MKKLLPVFLIFGLVALIPNAHATFGDVTMTQPQMVSSTGQVLGSSLHVGQQIGIQSTLTNHGQTSQKFTYIVQILSQDGSNEYLEGTSASMENNQSFNEAQVWIPNNPGQYTVQVYVWDSLASAIPLTNVIQTQITVSP